MAFHFLAGQLLERSRMLLISIVYPQILFSKNCEKLLFGLKNSAFLKQTTGESAYFNRMTFNLYLLNCFEDTIAAQRLMG